jgi:hypothetical protein
MMSVLMMFGVLSFFSDPALIIQILLAKNSLLPMSSSSSSSVFGFTPVLTLGVHKVSSAGHHVLPSNGTNHNLTNHHLIPSSPLPPMGGRAIPGRSNPR